MKRIRVEFGEELVKELGFGELIEKVERLEGVQILKLTPEEFVEVWKIRPKGSWNVKELKDNPIIEEVTIFSEVEGETHCLVRGKSAGLLSEVLKKFDAYYEYPLVYEKGKMALSVVGSGPQLEGLFEFFEGKGIDIKVLQVTDYKADEDHLEVLTSRQKEILLTAYQEGYFEFPKQSDAHQVAENLGITHATFLEHLRKAENRLLSRLL